MMKLYLLGGAERHSNQLENLYSLIAAELKTIQPHQILYIPFAQTKITPDERFKWFHDFISTKLGTSDFEVLNANYPSDVEQGMNPTIVISGGQSNTKLLRGIQLNPDLERLIANAEHLIGESAGAMLLGEYQRNPETNNKLMKGLNILEDTIIEPHYTEENLRDLLIHEMFQSKAKYGIGIDCITGVSFELKDFPNKLTKIGKGLVEVRELRDSKNSIIKSL